MEKGHQADGRRSYIELLTQEHAPQTVKQQLAAIYMLFYWMVIGQELPVNPAGLVRGPRSSIKKGKTPVLARPEMRRYLEHIDTSDIIGLRDRDHRTDGLQFRQSFRHL